MRAIHVIGASLAFAFLACGSGAGHTAVPSDLYIEAAAVAAQCTGRPLTPSQATALASEISRATGEPMSSREAMDRLAKAQAAFRANGDCGSPAAQVHIEFFRNLVSPERNSGHDEANTAG